MTRPQPTAVQSVSRTRPAGACRRNSQRRPSRRAGRRGVQSVEVIFILPMLLIVFLAAMQFGVVMVVQQAVAHAATVGAREAGKGADINEVACIVNRVLSCHCITVGTNASVILEDPEATPSEEQLGPVLCSAPPSPAIDSDEVRVTVCVDATSRPFLQALKVFGICCPRRLKASSVVAKEDNAGASPFALAEGCCGD